MLYWVPMHGSHAVLSAFVEIVFDNSDNRLPVSCRGTERENGPVLAGVV